MRARGRHFQRSAPPVNRKTREFCVSVASLHCALAGRHRDVAPIHHAATARRTPSKPGGVTAQVQSLTRGLNILEALARAEAGISLTDIAQRVELPPSTTHRLLSTLEKMGYVYQAGDLGHWYVGLQAFTVGAGFLANRDFVGQSHVYMRRLMEQSGETANLAILDGTEAVFIAQVQCREMMRILVKLGSRVPLHASGVGKAIFAALPDEQIDAILKVRGLPRITDPHDRRARNHVGSAQGDPAARLLVRRRGARAGHALRRSARLRRARGAARRDIARGPASRLP
jgi:IclR family acetate operon transcriptional repressor